MCYTHTCITFWLSVQQKGIYTEYLVIKKETLSPKSPKFPFSLHFFPSTVFIRTFSFLYTQVVFCLYNFAREIYAWPAKIDPVAHARCLTIALSIFKGSGSWIHQLLVPMKYIQLNRKTLSD